MFLLLLHGIFTIKTIIVKTVAFLYPEYTIKYILHKYKNINACNLANTTPTFSTNRLTVDIVIFKD